MSPLRRVGQCAECAWRGASFAVSISRVPPGEMALSHPSWPRWTMIPYLALADLQNTVLAAILTFADRVIYPTYNAVPRLWGMSALEDQATAGVIMWIPGSIAFLIPLGWLIVRQLAPRQAHRTGESLRGARLES